MASHRSKVESARYARQKGKRFEKAVRAQTAEAFGLSIRDCYATQGSGSGLFRGDAVLSTQLLKLFPVHMEMRCRENWTWQPIFAGWKDSKLGEWFREANGERPFSPGGKKTITLLVFSKNYERTYCLFRQKQWDRAFKKQRGIEIPTALPHFRLNNPPAFIFDYGQLLAAVAKHC